MIGKAGVIRLCLCLLLLASCGSPAYPYEGVWYDEKGQMITLDMDRRVWSVIIIDAPANIEFEIISATATELRYRTAGDWTFTDHGDGTAAMVLDSDPAEPIRLTRARPPQP